MAESKLGIMDGQKHMEWSEGLWNFDEDDWVLMALLQDPIHCAELLWEDPNNREYSGCYHVIDYQYPLFRPPENEAGFPCSRSVGKTESLKAQAVSHPFRRQRQDMLITAPQLIHLDPLCAAIEDRMSKTRLTREMLDTRTGKTGFTHKPFQVDFADGTKIIGRIPHRDGPQTLDSRLMTPTGWTTMGDVTPGDYVIGSDGHPTRVIAATDTWDAEVYAVEFTDGSVVKTDATHLWSLRSDAPAEYVLQETGDVVRALDGPPKAKGGKRNMWRVPPTPVVHYAPSPEPPLDPYVVGCLIGDGALTGHTPCLISADDELVEAVAALMPTGVTVERVNGKRWAWAITGMGRGVRNPVTTVLRDLGMRVRAPEKRIPPRYLYGSLDERLAVLQGIMDTDGTVKSGAAHVTSASRGLIEDVVQVARSLGGWASSSRETRREPGAIQGREFGGGVYWRATIRIAGMELFRLRRKLKRSAPMDKQRHKSVCAVHYIGEAPVRCIRVAARDGLYLTDGLTLTHNTGVKGQHVVDLRVEESQDYPEPGWTEVAPTLMRDTVDREGNPDFTFCFYGVHVPSREGTFYRSTQSGEFAVTTITAIMRPGWGPEEKRRWAAIYGGTTSADYRRNILGEAGSGAAAFFVTSRLFGCIDQNKESKYNTIEWKRQALRAEEIDKMVPNNDPEHTVGHLLDLPSGLGQQVFAGADIGLVNDPTVISLWATLPDPHKKTRLKLVRLFHLWEFREKQIRQCMYAIAMKYGRTLRGVGMDVTGLGLPLFQAMEDDEFAPKHLLEVSQGYVFNAKLPIGVDKSFTTEDTSGNIRDQFGNIVEKVEDPFTREVKYVVKMTMIEASTRYLREWVDTGYLWMPFDAEVAGDFQGESEQRVKAMAGTAGRKKVNAFHILDSARAMAMVKMHADVMEQVIVRSPVAVLDRAVDIAGATAVAGGMEAEWK